jgi:hypothetical protein
MPNKWHICKKGETGNKKDNCLFFLNYLVFLRPAADRAVSMLPWVVSRGRSYGFKRKVFSGDLPFMSDTTAISAKLVPAHFYWLVLEMAANATTPWFRGMA